MNTRTITGTIVRPSGAAWPNATLTFKLRARFVVDSDTVLPDKVTATTDADGAFSVALAVPDTGTASYEFTAPAGGSAVFYLEAGAPIELAALLATAAVHHHLIRQGLRMQTGLVVETGEAREVHHFCTLAGYGAEAVNPYLAFETLEQIRQLEEAGAAVEVK